MWNLFKTHEDIGISALAVIFVVILGGIFFWITTGVLADLNKAISPASGGNASATFDLDGARHLNLKGQTVPPQ